ncbi:NAD(P)H-dependent oxidoreductase [Paenibacillus sp. J5C_2022]|uniref:NADPH-dependent FMN reductase n=1 Tax=Paenibacillus sp. J5C2022 TaxID=2977129 RepID=UPI0021D2F49A|nr:NADPH-dependent FMN reductase [Paenibacillus sp. J5C2022]MCU6709162.1 NAD(P)H-dependent oxidoreductase [Paenibacillus sp. J5C2022]
MKIAIVAGSNRSSATSTRLAEYGARLTRSKGHDTELFDLYRTPLPFYCPDEYYEGHKGLTQFKELMRQADAVVLATPEYHGSVSGVLKNALDFLGKEHLGGKPVLSLSSAGGAVGVSSLQHLQTIIRNVHGINVPEWISIGGSQREWFRQARGDEQPDEAIALRINRAWDAFLELARLVRGL